MGRTTYAKLVLEERTAPKTFKRVLLTSLKRNRALVMPLLMGLVIAAVLLIIEYNAFLAWLLSGLVVGRASSLVHNVRSYLVQAPFAHDFIDRQRVEAAAKGDT